ncbi:MAG: von Willebrand factor type A domain-containing protein, partial [Burkholderiales bacterium]
MRKQALGVWLVASLVGLAFVTARLTLKARSSGGGPAGIAAVPPAPPSPASTPPGTLAPTAVPAQRTAPSAAKPPAPYEAPIAASRALLFEGRDDGARQSALRSVATGVAGGVASSPAARQEALAKLQAVRPEFDTEAYDRIRDNPFMAAAQNPLSTFSIDVDTASYANVRRFLTQGQLPPKDAVRIEELVNYFRYDYPEPKGGAPFSVTTELAPCPWRPEHRLALVGLRGRSLEEKALPPRRLTFLLDVSGSMESPDKLPLLKQAMALLVEGLREQDQVAIVVYAGQSGLVLPPTSGERKAEIRAALAALEAGGSTAGGAGIELAYRVAAEMYRPGAINRVLLATDGDFNVGVTSVGELSRLIEEKRKSGVFLSVLGFGQGNLKDATMEMLADRGNGNYSYIDSEAEAKKVLVSEAGATLVTIAKDVKIQVEWNPRRVAGYRLVGYENRLLRAEDFDDDRKDAGEIGAGHTVTALYEVVPAGLPLDAKGAGPLKYQQPPAQSPAATSDELLTLKLRYKE